MEIIQIFPLSTEYSKLNMHFQPVFLIYHAAYREIEIITLQDITVK